jgi:hypothetical protein
MYTNITAWETAAAAAGLTIDSESFTFAPNLASFAVGPATFAVVPGFGFYSVANRRLESDFSDILIDYTAGSFVFGFGYDYTVSRLDFGVGPRIRVTDVDNVQQLARRDLVASGFGFLGIIGTSAFDPSNPQWQSSIPQELNIAGGTASSLSGLSVAYAVPEPGAGLLLGLTMAGLSALRKPRLGRAT